MLVAEDLAATSLGRVVYLSYENNYYYFRDSSAAGDLRRPTCPCLYPDHLKNISSRRGSVFCDFNRQYGAGFTGRGGRPDTTVTGV